MPITALQHYGITVSRKHRGSRFYSKLMGLPRLGSVTQKPHRSMIGKYLGAPTVTISWHQAKNDAVELFTFPDVQDDPLPPLRRDFSRPGPSRLAFRVPSLNILERKLEDKNIEFKKAVDPWGEEYLSFTDADMVPVAAYGNAEKTTQLEHATITVSNLDRSTAFYSVVLNLPETGPAKLAQAREIFPDSRHDTTIRVARVGIAGKGVQLVEFQGIDYSGQKQWFPDPGDPYDVKYPEIGIKHVCFQATDTRRWTESLKKDGVRIIMGPAREPTGLKVTYLLDPDGVVVELYDLPKALSKAMSGFSYFWARFMTRKA